MLKLSRLTDYAAIIMAQIARYPESSCAATDIAEAVRLPHPTVSKTLKMLVRAGLLNSSRGAQGGYRLARDPARITVIDIITAMEGPVAITECSHEEGTCELIDRCDLAGNWQRVTQGVRTLLDSVTLAHLAAPTPIKLPVRLPIQSVTLATEASH